MERYSDRLPHALAKDDLLARYDSTPADGLTDEQVERRLLRFGFNELPEGPGTSWWSVVFEQLRGLVVMLLLGAATVAVALDEWIDAAAILMIVAMNTFLGVYQHFKTERALAALQKLSAPLAKVVRNGALREIEARLLVPGDRIEIQAGDHVPADARLLKCHGLQTLEAPLTGESTPVVKELCSLPESTELGDRRNMVYMGTAVALGQGTALVVGTGQQTELGRVAKFLGAPSQTQTPLKLRFDQLGRSLVVLCLVLVAGIAALQIARGVPPLDTLRFAVSLAVAAVPEGLPAVLTITLAMGAMRLARHNALVRQLSSVETLGSVTVICSDKTGTLTRNEMTVREIFTPDGNYSVSGSGYAPHGEITRRDTLLSSMNKVAGGANGEATADSHGPMPGAGPDVRWALTIGCWCNHADVVLDPRGINTWRSIGDPTEAALVVAARKASLGRESKAFQVEHQLTFDSDRKLMSVVLVDHRQQRVVMTKGAPEELVARCRYKLQKGVVSPLSAEDRAEISRANVAMASHALRVLGLAYRENVDPQVREGFEHDLVFAGLVGMIDPPREEAKRAIAACHSAGIRPVMITGDHPATARAVGAELGLAIDSSAVVTGRELDEMSDDDLKNRLPRIGVFARVSAEHKLRVVRALRSRNEIVAMTGDGVNDAPAVQNAHIGIAMGTTGTDVTKQSAALVLMDDNFATIVRAVEEGRAIFDNILKFVHYLLAGNAGKLLFMLAVILMGWPDPLLPLQILWLNLVTDGLPALALGAEPTARGLMARRPRGVHEPLIGGRRVTKILLHGALTALAALVGFAVIFQGDPARLSEAQLVAFCVLGLGQLAYAFVCRSEAEPLSKIGWTTNRALLVAVTMSLALQLSVVLIPTLHQPFGIEAYPDTLEWTLIIVLSFFPAFIVELGKRFSGGYERRSAAHVSHGTQSEFAPSNGQNS